MYPTKLCSSRFVCGFLFFVGALFASVPVFATTVGAAKDANASGRNITLDFYLENFGAMTATDISMPDNLDAVFGAGNYTILSGPTFVDNPGTLTLDTNFDGSAMTDLLVSASSTLAVGDTAQIQVVIELTSFSDQGMGLGVYSNQVTVEAMINGANVMDLSTSGTDPDPSGDGDPGGPDEGSPTIVDALANPIIGVAKNAMLNGTQVTLDFYLENFGNRTLQNVSVIDDLDGVFGAGNYTITAAPSFLDDPGSLTLNAGFDGSGSADLIASGTLGMADTAAIRILVDITTVSDQGLGVGFYSNQATAMADADNGPMTSDISGNGIDPDANGNNIANEDDDNEPTLIIIGEEPNVGVAKSAAVNNSVVTLNFFLENLGNVTVDSLTLIDDLNAVFGAGNFFISGAPTFIDDPGTITLNPSYDGNFDTALITSAASNLAAADTAQIQVQVTIFTLSDQGSGLGVYSNQVMISGEGPNGGTTIDLSDNGTNPDPNGNGDPTEMGENDPTPITVPAVASIGVAKRFVIESITGGVPRIRLEFTVTNYGNQRVDNISVSDDLNAVYGAGNFIHITDPTYAGGANSFNYNPAFNGSTNTSLLLGGSFLDPGESTTFSIVHILANLTDQGFGIGMYQNQVTVVGTDPMASPVSDMSTSGDDPDPNGNGDPTEMGENEPTVIDVTQTAAIGIAKDAGVVGEVVTLDFYIENLGGITLQDMTFIENLDNVFGAGNYTIGAPSFIDDPGTMTLNPDFDGTTANQEMLLIASSSLGAGDTAQIQLIVTVNNVTDAQNLGIGTYSNQVTINAQSTLGQFVTDISDFGTDPDPNGDGNANEPGENDATPIVIAVDTPIGIAKDAGVAGNVVTIDLYIESFGPSTLSNVNITEDLDATFGAGNYTITTPPAFIDDPGTLTLNGSFDGSSDMSLFAAGSTLSPMDTAQVQFVLTVDTESDQGNGFGIYSNQAIVSGDQPSGATVSDQSDDGTDPDPNGNGNPSDAGENDATPIIIALNPVIGIAKNATVSGTLVTLDFYVENLGDSTLTNVLLQDPLNPVFGSGNYMVIPGGQPTLVSGPDTLIFNSNFFGLNPFTFVIAGGFIRPGDIIHFRVQVNVTNVTDQGNGLGIFDNGVTINATDPAGGMVTDVSDHGIDPDPNGNGNPDEAGESDPTRIIIGDEANLGAAKTASVTGAQVTLDLFLENFGGSTLNSLSVVEDLDAVFGPGNYMLSGAPTLVDDPGTFAINPGFDGSGTSELIAIGGTLAALDTAQIQVVVDVTNVTDQGLGFGNYQNQVMVSGIAPLGTRTQDLSDSGTDPDPNGNGFPNDDGEDDPTIFSVGFSEIGAAKNATVNGNEVTLDFYIENFGSTGLLDIVLADDLDAVFGAGNYSIVSGPTRISPPRDLEVNPNFDGSGDTSLVLPGGMIGLGVTEQIRVVVNVDVLTDQGSGLGVYSNQVTAMAIGVNDLSDSGTDPDPNGNSIPNDMGEDDPTPIIIPEDPIIGVAKTAAVTGRMVTFNAFLESFGNVDLSSVSVIDDLDATFGAGNYTVVMPPSFIVDPGTLNLNAGFDGSGANDLLAAGSTLAMGATAQIRFGVMVTTVTDQGLGSGMYENQITASAVGPGGAMTSDLSDDGTDADPSGNNDPTDADEDDATAFELQGTIGDFVWNDLNGDGIQDGGEPGLAGIQVYLDLNTNGTFDMGEPTANTDGLGAYDFTNLDADTYAVRINDTTLPLGFNLTTANLPQIVALTAGEDFNDADFGYQQQNASIGDRVFNDADGDGIDGGGKSGLAGIRVYLDLDNSGDRSVTEPTALTDASGAYDLTGLAAGSYTVRIEPITVPAGFNLTTANLPLLVNLAAGEDFNDADFGYQQQDSSIGDLAFRDLNGNGIFDGGEPGQANLVIYLDLNMNGMPDVGEPSGISDGGGTYDIQNLPAGTYTLRVDPSSIPTGYVVTTGNDPSTVMLANGEDFNDADFGIQQQDATIGDFVWNDLNGDGIQDGGEPGLAGVTVFLDLNTNGMIDAGEPTTATDGSGAYDFTNLATGTYAVTIDSSTIPAGFVLTGGVNPTNVTLAAGEDFNDADFGFQQQDATIGDFVWNDLNGDGVQDAGEPGLAGVTVFLDLNSNGVIDGGEPSATTDGVGAYDLTGLPTGTYSVNIDGATIPAGYVFITMNLPLVVNLAAGEDFNTADFGYQRQDATIGDFVWNDLNGDGVQDGGEPGFDNVTIDLIDDANGNGMIDGGEAVLQTQTTMGGGAYDFTGLAVGNYIVNVTDTNNVLTDYILTGGTNPRAVALIKGGDVNDADFGYQRSDGTIGDFVWNDLNGDGVQDGGEPGFDNVTLDLIEDTNGNGMIDGGEPVVQTQTTAGGGAYDFNGLTVGDYLVTVTDTNNVLTTYVLTGGTDPAPVTLIKGGDLNDVDFGYQNANGMIGDFVWNDLNGDGVQDAGEPGLDNVTLDLIDDANSNGVIDGGEAVLETQTTMGGGAYNFTALRVGDYIVNVTDTNNVLAAYNQTGGMNPVAVSLTKGQDFDDADFGYQREDGTIGDFVWNDLNGDGVQDAGEPGFGNVTVDLIDDANGNGVIDAGEPVLDTQTTDGAGAYDFTMLTVGTYIVDVTDTNNILDDYGLTGGTDPLPVDLTKGQDFDGADFGYQREDGTIGDFVWNDLNGDGVQDAGEPGFGNVTLDLIDDTNGNGVIDAGEPVLDTQTTDGAGAYDFTMLTVGNYIVDVTDTNNILDDYGVTGGTDPLPVDLTKGQDFDDADFGYQRGDGTIGDLVFNDFDGNGLQDPGETGFENVTLDLIDDANGNGTVDAGEPVLDTQTTDASGNYLFEGLTVGDYLVLVTDTNAVLTGLDLTTASDPFPVNLIKGGEFLDADFGYLDNRAIIGVSKSATTAPLMITYNFQVENFGTVPLTDVSMPEDLDAVFGAGTYVVIAGPSTTAGNAANASGNPNFDGSTDTEMFAPNSNLDVGEFIILSITIEVTDPPPLVNGPISYTNQVTVSAFGPTGNPVTDESTDGEFPDPDGNGDPRDDGTPTLVYLPLPVPTLGEWGMIAMVIGLIGAALWMRRRTQAMQS